MLPQPHDWPETAVTDPQIRKRAATLGEKLRQEDGVATAVKQIESYFAVKPERNRVH